MNKQRILAELAKLLDHEQLTESEILAKIDGILWILYPRGVQPAQYAGLVRTVRVLDRLCRLLEVNEPVEAAPEPTPEPIVDPVADAPTPVDDDTTSPIRAEELFGQAMRTKQATWATLTRGTVRTSKESSEESSVGPYSSIFKYKPEPDEAG